MTSKPIGNLLQHPMAPKAPKLSRRHFEYIAFVISNMNDCNHMMLLPDCGEYNKHNISAVFGGALKATNPEFDLFKFLEAARLTKAELDAKLARKLERHNARLAKRHADANHKNQHSGERKLKVVRG